MSIQDIFQRAKGRTDAIEYLGKLKREALANKRACSKVNNPLAPVPGMEKDFEEADRIIKTVNFMLKEISLSSEKHWTRLKAKRFAISTADTLLYIMVGLGLLGIAAVGLSSLCLVLRISPLVLLGGAVATSIIVEAWKYRRPRN